MAYSGRFLVDTGPIVAFLRKREAAHKWADEMFRELPTPLLTCEPVLVETFFLLASEPGGLQRFFEFLSTGLLVINFSVLPELKTVARLAAKYKELPMSLTDACLVRMAELNPGAKVLTLDKHFHIYRINDRQVIPTLMPS